MAMVIELLKAERTANHISAALRPPVYFLDSQNENCLSGRFNSLNSQGLFH